MTFVEKFFPISRIVINQLEIYHGGESSLWEQAVQKALLDPDWPKSPLQAKETRTINRPFLVEISLLEQLEARAQFCRVDPAALVDLALYEALDEIGS